MKSMRYFTLRRADSGGGCGIALERTLVRSLSLAVVSRDVPTYAKASVMGVQQSRCSGVCRLFEQWPGWWLRPSLGLEYKARACCIGN